MTAFLQRLFDRLGNLKQDARYAVRGLRQQPGFALGVVLTIALGIGANAVMFSLVDRLLFRPPPYLRESGSVHRVFYNQTLFGKDLTSSYVSYPLYQIFRSQTTAFSQVAGFATREVAIGVGELARQHQIAAVSAGFFDFFDAPPTLGRYFFSTDDSLPEGQPVAVLSHAMWVTEYGARPDILGTHVQIGAVQYTVVGVTPPGFNGLWPDQPPAAFVPMTTYAANDQWGGNPFMGSRWPTSYGWNWLELMVRRKPDVSISAASSDLDKALMIGARAQLAENPRFPGKISRAIAAPVLIERGPNPSETGKVAVWVTGVAAIVLLIATANVANLFLARALRRRREVAVRVALGVTRARLLSQLLTESVLLALAGGVAGILLAQWGGGPLRAALLPRTESLSTWQDVRSILLVTVAALLVGTLTGLASAWQASQTDLTVDLKAGAREGTSRRSRVRPALLVLQAALSVLLLVGAGLFVRSLDRVQHERMGYDVDPVIWAALNMRGVKLDSAEKVNLRLRLIEAARKLPEVAEASQVLTPPLFGRLVTSLFVPGHDSLNQLGVFYVNAVSPQYFTVMGTRIVRGRAFTDSDPRPARLTVVSEAMAKILWPNDEALGKCIRIRADTMPCITVVGVAENIKATQLDADPGLYYYLPAEFWNPSVGELMIRARGEAGAARVQESIRRELQRLMPGNSYLDTRLLAEIIGEQTRSWRLGAMMFLAFGILALVVAAVGLYSVVGYDVTQRSHELGVRVALGARAGDITWLVIGQGLQFVLIGVGLGGVLALVAGRWVQPLLFKESARDPVVFALVIVVLLVVALIATMVPARKASRVNPNLTLKAE